MAISEDTVALVAAQLTVAWATRAGVGNARARAVYEDEVLDAYEAFSKRIDPRKTAAYNIDNLT